MKINYHSQNLNEDKSGEIKGSIIRHGRAWLSFGPKERFEIAWEWLFFSKWFFMEFEYGGYDNEDFGFKFGFLIFKLYVHINGILPKKMKNYHWPRSTGFNIYDWCIIVNVWNDDSVWSRDQPWWNEIRIDFKKIPDFIFGRVVRTEELIKTEKVSVPMPESHYDGEVKVTRVIRKRTRWFWKKVRIESWIDIKGGIPVPGKGEDSWNCGEDSITGTGSRDGTVEGAISQIIHSALRTRVRYGGKDWRPEPKPLNIKNVSAERLESINN